MIKTQILLWKTIKVIGFRGLGLGLGLGFFYFILNLQPTDLWYNMLQTLLGQKNIWAGNFRRTPSLYMLSLKAWSGKPTVTGMCIFSSICIKLVNILNLVLRKSEVKKIFKFWINSPPQEYEKYLHFKH